MSDTPDYWNAVAEYVRTVAEKAFSMGFSDGQMHSRGTVDRDAQRTETRMYVAHGFEPDVVKRFHPAARDNAPEDTAQVMSDAGVISVVRSVYRQQGNVL